MINGGTALNPWKSGGNLSGSAGSAGISMIFFTSSIAVLLVPWPDRRRQVFQRGDHTHKAVRPCRFVSGAQFQHHLLLGPQVQHLQMTPLAKVPHVERVTVAALEQDLWIDAVFTMLGVPHSLVTIVS